MEILTGEQMRRVDRRAIEQLGIPGLELMESAGRGVATALLEDFPAARSSAVCILCGRGNNGGDGLVAARHLLPHGVTPTVLLIGEGTGLSADAAHNLAAARECGLDVDEIPDRASWEAVSSRVGEAGVVVDALLGTGVRGGARGLVAEVIERINELPGSVISIDLPSGVEADCGAVEGAAVLADRTYTLCRPKVALVLGPAQAHAGRWRVVPIGIPDRIVADESVQMVWLDGAEAGQLLPARPRDSHKGSYGHLLAVAGSRGKSGAAVLLARGALRCGVGLVTVAVPTSCQAMVAAQQAELMTEPLDEGATGGLGPEAAQQALRLAAGRDAIAVGPGLGTETGCRSAALELIRQATAPLVVDADGLNALAEDPGDRPILGGEKDHRVLTPHPGEAARLLGSSTGAVQSDRLGAARELAATYDSVVVLKGHHSLIASPDGSVAVNSSGNPGMATGGSGDVLTGAVGAFLARGLSAWDAARLATYVHGDAGDQAAEERGQEGMIASDIIEALPAALRRIAGEGPGR